MSRNNRKPRLGFILSTAGAILPKYQTEGAGAFDLHADFTKHDVPVGTAIPVEPGAPVTFDTGIIPVIPKGWVLLVFSRSGHGFKSDIRLANCVGVIDSDYQGTIGVKLTCDALWREFEVKHGDRIAQAILMPAPQVELYEAFAEDIAPTERGANGFGSTGNQ
ncbi:deoxyuridine 5'-triphosphate nucleotidohydrolase [Pseudomonas phage Ppu-503]|nr:deoxyuridine 5'-triphosphate nucleotidohydrolase [Pseudomonas phage Ppu-503]